jgi:2-polyprenyl-6-hydroxyphenyl methylase/3-demethylubiquinone-9 3-methyltransferase
MAKNLLSSDVALFDDKAHQWWDPNGDLWTLHRINPLRMKWIEQIVPLKNQSVLDVGCGGGLLSEGMAKQGACVLGIDLAPNLIEIARNHAEQENVSSLNYACQPIAECQETYTVITCMEMLEHVDQPNLVIEQCASRLKPNGWLFVSTINQTFQAWVKAIVLAEHVLKWVPKGSHRLDRLITPAQMTHWANLSGLELKHMCGVSYRPLSGMFVLSDQIDTNYMMAFQVK